MMTTTRLLRARAGATAIAAALALSSTPAPAQNAPAPDSTAAPAANSPNTAPAPKPKIQPIVDLSSKPAAAPKAAPGPAQPAYAVDQDMLMLGGGALALLLVGGGAFALSRRRRRREEEARWQDEAAEPEARDPLFDEPMFQHQPAAEEHRPAAMEDQPAMVAPPMSAFGWDKTQPGAQPCDDPTDDGSDRCPGESWVERAHRGPSPANPSASLKHRLSRAAFFDKRERDVAAGTAEPIDPDAGLPEAMVDEQEREQA